MRLSDADIRWRLTQFDPMREIKGEVPSTGDWYCLFCLERTRRYEPGHVTNHKDDCLFDNAVTGPPSGEEE